MFRHLSTCSTVAGRDRSDADPDADVRPGSAVLRDGPGLAVRAVYELTQTDWISAPPTS